MSQVPTPTPSTIDNYPHQGSQLKRFLIAGALGTTFILKDEPDLEINLDEMSGSSNLATPETKSGKVEGRGADTRINEVEIRPGLDAKLNPNEVVKGSFDKGNFEALMQNGGLENLEVLSSSGNKYRYKFDYKGVTWNILVTVTIDETGGWITIEEITNGEKKGDRRLYGVDSELDDPNIIDHLKLFLNRVIAARAFLETVENDI